MSFRETVKRDIHRVFLNTEEFAEKRVLKYDGEVYTDIPVVISERKMSMRERSTVSDHLQGLYLWDVRVDLALADIGGRAPERGSRIYMSTNEEGTFFQSYYVAMSKTEMGIVILELEELDE